MKFKTLLKESYSALKHRPILFAPKTISVIISSIWIIKILNSFPQPSVYLYTLPVIMVATIFATFLLVEMIKSLKIKGQIRVKSVLKSTLRRSKAILMYIILLFLSSLSVALITASGFFIYSLRNSLIILFILLVLSISLLLLTSAFFYFLPVAIGLENGFRQGLNNSIYFADNYRKELIMLFVLSLFLLSIGFMVQGVLELLGYVGFLLSRVVSAGISTYLFVLSSEVYSEAF